MGQLTVFQLIDNQQGIFESAGSDLEWAKERLYAGQLLSASNFATNLALKNPTSVTYAMTNLSSIGLSLNPATKYAYLVPRDNKICLDISYMGLIKIATDSGSILWAKAEAVYQNDNFVYKGVAKMPEIQCDPFKPRGDFSGVYCVAKTIDGDFLVGTMSADEIYTIRGRSKAYSSGKSCPWKTDFIEMAKKTIIKRDSKTWPKSMRMMHASDILNEHEGYTDEYLVNPENKPKYKHESELTKEDAEKIAAQLTYLVGDEDSETLLDNYTQLTGEQQLDVWQYLESSTRSKAKKLMTQEKENRTIQGN